MIVDWAVSLFVVTLIVFGLIVATEVEFAAVERTYGAQVETGSVSEIIADKVARLEALTGNTRENFTYGPNAVADGPVTLPSDLNGRPYSLVFTHDYVVVLTMGGTPVGTASDFWQPVYLFNLSTVQKLAVEPMNGTVLTAMSQTPAGMCMGLVSGANFTVTHENVRVDGHGEYLTIISSADGLDHGCG